MKKFTSQEIKEFISKPRFDKKIILNKDLCYPKINWTRISNHYVMGKLLRLALRMIPHSIVMRIRYGSCRGMKWIVGTSNHGCWLGTYELEKQKAIQGFIKSGMIIYDIGAHAGIYSLLFSKLVGQNGKVFAFEPYAENVANFLKHIRLNRLNNVILIQSSITDKSGLASFLIGGSSSMGSITYIHTYLQIPTFSLDELVFNFNFPLSDLVKMDVEGAEAMVIKGMQRLIIKKKTIIFIALHGDEQKRLCQNILLENGYKLFWLNGDKIKGRLEDFQDNEIYALRE